MDKRVERHMSHTMIRRCGDVVHEFGWEHELELLNVIRTGQTELLSAVLLRHQVEHDRTVEDVQYSDNKEESDFYRFITAVTLFSRAAIEGGVPELRAYSMQESYIYCARKYRLDLFMDALYSFTEAVAECRSEKGEAASLAWKIKSFIIQNLNQPLTIERISSAVCLSTSRCSHLFKEQTGLTIRQYIEQERIRAAKAALLYYDMEISGISEYLTFSSPSHFSSVFRKSTGLSPKEWRLKYRGQSRENAFFRG